MTLEDQATQFLSDGKNPARLGNYRIVRQIGQGAMGQVYEAMQESLERRVALKVLTPWMNMEQRHIARFEREAKLAAQLDHPGIVRIYEFGREKGVVFIAMEYVDGQDLRRLLDSGERPPDAEWVRIYRDALHALQYAHDRGLIHRDIKPANIMLDTQGQVKLADFGLCRADATEPLTRSGEVLGTAQYMSPEQAGASDDCPVTTRSDVYSMGTSLYECLTGGSFPYDLEGVCNVVQLFVTISRQRRIPLAERRPEIDPALDRVVLKAIEKEPERRYASAAEFADELDRALAGEQISAPSPRSAERRELIARLVAHRLTTAAVALLLTLLAGGSWYLLLRLEAAHGEARAAQQTGIGLRRQLVRLRTEAKLREATAALDRGDAAGAEQALRPARFLSREHPRVWQLSARAAERRGDWSAAGSHWSKLAALRPGPEAQLGQARALRHQGQPARALAELEGAIERWPQEAGLALERGKTLAALGRWQPALDSLQQASSLGSRTPALFELMVQVAEKAGLPPARLDRYRRLGQFLRRLAQIDLAAGPPGRDEPLEALAHPSILPELTAALDQQKLAVRVAAAYALGASGTLSAAPALVAALARPAPELRHAALEGLRALTGRSLGFEPAAPAPERAVAIARWKAWIAGTGKQPRDKLLAEALASAGLALPAGAGKPRLERLVAALGARDWWIRHAAYTLLRGASGQELPFDPRGKPRLRQAQAEAWRHWVASRAAGGGR